MDIEKAFESIQNNLIVTRERDHCITQVCPCCGKYKFSADPSNVMGNCLDCGYTVMNNRGTIERFKGQGVFALSHGAKGGFQLLKADGKPQLKHYLKLLQMLLIVRLMNLIIVFFILLKMIK